MTEITEVPNNYLDLLNDPKKVTVFGKSYCLRTKKTKSFLKKMKVDFQYVDIDKLIYPEDQRFVIDLQAGFMESPKIFIGKKCIGTLKDLLDAQKKGKLAQEFEMNEIPYDRTAMNNYNECRIF